MSLDLTDAGGGADGERGLHLLPGRPTNYVSLKDDEKE